MIYINPLFFALFVERRPSDALPERYRQYLQCFRSHRQQSTERTKGHRKGHRKIAYIHGEDTAVTRGRLTGFHQACKELGLEIPPEYITPCVYHDPDLCYKATQKLLQLPELPTCFLFPDDFSFIGGLNALLESGLTIPNGKSANAVMSVMGYDGIKMARLIQLATYSQNAAQIGRTAAAKLIHRIEEPKEFHPEQILIAGSLLEGLTVQDLT